jgi:hypothetical protein
MFNVNSQIILSILSSFSKSCKMGSAVFIKKGNLVNAIIWLLWSGVVCSKVIKLSSPYRIIKVVRKNLISTTFKFSRPIDNWNREYT